MSSRTATTDQQLDIKDAGGEGDDRLDLASSLGVQSAAEKLQEAGSHYVTEPARDLGSLLRDYAHDKPEVAAMWCFGLGLLVGWKLRR